MSKITESVRKGLKIQEAAKRLQVLHNSNQWKDSLEKHGWKPGLDSEGNLKYSHGNHGAHNIVVFNDDGGWQHNEDEGEDSTIASSYDSFDPDEIDLGKHLSAFHSGTFKKDLE